MTISVPNVHNLELRVPFRDVDSHGHVHNAIYMAYFEQALSEFIRHHNLAGFFGPRSTTTRYHVRKTEVVYERPAGYDDRLGLDVCLTRLGETSLTFACEAMMLPDRALVARGTITWVCVRVGQDGATSIPADCRARLSEVMTEAATAAAT